VFFKSAQPFVLLVFSKIMEVSFLI